MDITQPRQEFKCEGEMIFDTRKISTDFILRQFQNGRILGEIEYELNFKEAYDLFKSAREFKLRVWKSLQKIK